MSPSRQVLLAVFILLAVVVVQWFVANVALAIDCTAPSHPSEKVIYGLRTAVFADVLDGEGAVIVTIGMLIVPVLVGVEYLGAVAGRRATRRESKPAHFFPHARVLIASWVWLVYWPFWSLLMIGGPSFLTFIGGSCVVPPLVAFAIGYRAAKRAEGPRQS